jgi:hypothetical protein
MSKHASVLPNPASQGLAGPQEIPTNNWRDRVYGEKAGFDSIGFSLDSAPNDSTGALTFAPVVDLNEVA